MKKEYITINGKRYQKANTTFWDIAGGLAVIGGLSFLIVGTIGTVVLALLGLA
jgi:hypothetical protein